MTGDADQLGQDETLPAVDPSQPSDALGGAATIEAGATPAPRSFEGRAPAVPEIDRFAVLDEIGHGGMGTVYAAFDRRLDRKVAIKVLRQGTDPTPEQRTRMLREAQAMARLSHPNVIPVFEVGEADGQIYVAMEFVDGPTLGQWQVEQRAWPEILAMYVAVGRGLAAAHAQGLVHRDFKPHNVLVGTDGRPRVIDFGLARMGQGAEPEPTPRPDDEPEDAGLLDSPLTHAGAVVGTPAYMAPEQLRGGDVVPASDQFSFCMALYEALYGQRAYPRRSMAEMFDEREPSSLPVPEGTDVPPWLHAAVIRGLAGDPEARWPSLDALLEVLDQDPTKNPATGRRTRGLIVGGLAALAAVVWPLVETERDGPELEAVDLVMVAVVSGALFFGVAFALRARIAKSERTKMLVHAGYLMVAALLVHRSLGWLGDVAPPTLLMTDHVILGLITAMVARASERWVWVLVLPSLVGAVISALQPAWAVSSFGLTTVVVLMGYSVGFLRRD